MAPPILTQIGLTTIYITGPTVALETDSGSIAAT